MYKDYFEVHEAEYEAMTEWLAYEADMATDPNGATAAPTEAEMEEMFLLIG
jgi:hypothetical protein